MKIPLCSRLLALSVLCSLCTAVADGPQDNIAENVRRIPKLGVEVPPEKRATLEAKLAELKAAIGEVEKKGNATSKALLPDVWIYHKAVNDALKYQEFFAPAEIDKAAELLTEGIQRAKHLQQGQSPWTSATGLVVRGYVSKLDGSVQPYGLVVPSSYQAQGAQRHRLDLWFHGRGETLSELNFLNDRRRNPGQFTPADTLVLHPYGRYSNANKFAGEIDALESMEAVKKHYRVDEDRVLVRGFSMGGASTWQLAVHYPSLWAAANPGAGFSETPEFLKSFQQEKLDPPWYEERLWRMYNATDWAVNIFHCPTVAYSGEVDRQKQAADIMQAALEREKMDLVHIIGPQTQHKYHPDSKEIVDGLLTSLAEKGRDRMPRQFKFTTFTLRYPQVAWIRVEGMQEHWQAARLEGRLNNHSTLSLTTQNITALSFDIPPGYCPLDVTEPVKVQIDGTTLTGPRPKTDRSWSMQIHREGDLWKEGALGGEGLRKRPGLQGPIDDALMDAFVFVRPTGEPQHPEAHRWAVAELERAIEHWRRHFRGEPRVKNDVDVTEQDMAAMNLILWGDAASNRVLAKLADRLPIKWTKEGLQAGGQTFEAAHHAPVMIYPNPLNADRYVVLNSSFTFREYDYLNNARQTPKLPDWAIVDLRTPPNSRWPGKVVAADFFDESWKFREKK